jgi:ABC-2 type transport system permease protein
MIAQMRSEWIKFRTVRSTVVLTILAIILAAGVAVLAGFLTKGTMRIDDCLGGVQVASLLILVLGVQIVGQEYRFSTIRPTFSATPRRGRVILAKLSVLALTTAVAAVALMALSVLCAFLVTKVHGTRLDLSAPGTSRVLIGTVVVLVIHAILGFGVGCIVRQPIAGIVIVLVWVTVVEGILIGLLPDYVRWFPIAGMANVNALVLHHERGPDTLRFFGPVVGALYSTAIGLALVALGWLRIRTSDA